MSLAWCHIRFRASRNAGNAGRAASQRHARTFRHWRGRLQARRADRIRGPKLADEIVRTVAAIKDTTAAPKPWHWLGIALGAAMSAIIAARILELM
jgi:hypothetical protein